MIMDFPRIRQRARNNEPFYDMRMTAIWQPCFILVVVVTLLQVFVFKQVNAQSNHKHRAGQGKRQLTSNSNPEENRNLFQHPKLIDSIIPSQQQQRSEQIIQYNNDWIVPHAYIVRFHDNVTDVEGMIQQLIYESGDATTIIKHIYKNVFKGIAIIQSSNSRMTTILDNTIVKSASRNRIIKSLQLNEIITENTTLWNLDRIVLPPRDKKYQYKYDGTDVDVYILDTGIRVTHEEFQFMYNNIVYSRASCGWDAYATSCNDKVGHGSHVAGIVGGKTYGVAKNVNLISVKVLSDYENGTSDDAIAGIDWVTDQKIASPDVPAVINLSLDGGYDIFFNDAVEAAVYYNVTVVASAGNDGLDACYYSPGSTPEAITVGATDRNDQRASYSNIGSCVDILAPGTDIVSVGVESNTTRISLTGTSMAAPHVTGLVALQLQRNRTWTPTQVWDAIKSEASVDVINIPKPRVLLPLRLIYRLFPRFKPPTLPDETPNLFITANGLLK